MGDDAIGFVDTAAIVGVAVDVNGATEDDFFSDGIFGEVVNFLAEVLGIVVDVNVARPVNIDNVVDCKCVGDGFSRVVDAVVGWVVVEG